MFKNDKAGKKANLKSVLLNIMKISFLKKKNTSKKDYIKIDKKFIFIF